MQIDAFIDWHWRHLRTYEFSAGSSEYANLLDALPNAWRSFLRKSLKDYTKFPEQDPLGNYPIQSLEVFPERTLEEPFSRGSLKEFSMGTPGGCFQGNSWRICQENLCRHFSKEFLEKFFRRIPERFLQGNSWMNLKEFLIRKE